jgi:hypothetical protein
LWKTEGGKAIKKEIVDLADRNDGKIKSWEVMA